MRVSVPKETAPGERRVALVPETVSKLGGTGFAIRVERGAGESAGFRDGDYADAGAELVDRGVLCGHRVQWSQSRARRPRPSRH